MGVDRMRLWGFGAVGKGAFVPSEVGAVENSAQRRA